ncbi:MAG: hypothetical protein ACR2MO_07190 [Acidimicrobiales bacterium]
MPRQSLETREAACRLLIAPSLAEAEDTWAATVLRLTPDLDIRETVGH